MSTNNIDMRTQKVVHRPRGGKIVSLLEEEYRDSMKYKGMKKPSTINSCSIVVSFYKINSQGEKKVILSYKYYLRNE